MKTFRLFLAILLLQTAVFAYIGKIAAMSREVSIIRDSKSTKASSGHTIEQKDTIKTSKGGVAQIEFNDKTVITVGENSIFSVEEYLNDDKAPNARFKADKGYFKVVTGQIGKVAPDKFKIDTKTATIGIRGTEFKGFVDELGNLTTLTTKGTTVVTSTIPNVAVKSTEVPAGYMTRATQNGIEISIPFSTDELKNINTGFGGYVTNSYKQEDISGNTKAQSGIVGKIRDITTKAIGYDLNDKTYLAANTIEAKRLEAVKAAALAAAQAKAARIVAALTTGGSSSASGTTTPTTPSVWAASGYSANYAPGVSYNTVGYSSFLTATSASLHNGGSGDLTTAFNMDLAANTFNSANSFDPTMVTTAGSFSISGEDSFSATQTGSFWGFSDATLNISTTSDSSTKDYVSWGYWNMTYNSGNIGKGVWIGGIPTISMPSTGTASYSGTVIGYTGTSGQLITPIDAGGTATFNVNFAAPTITGNINFTSGGHTWIANIASTSISGNSFSADRTNTLSGTRDGIPFFNSAGTNVNGKFYGPNANVVGGSFTLMETTSTPPSKAVGVFKANR